MRGIKRNLESKAKTLLDLFPAVIILGARQTGKTTLAQRLKPNWTYIDLEKPSDYERISQDPEFFFKQYPSQVIIDEAQHYPIIFKILRGVIDNDRSLTGRFIITGSSSPELLKQTSESLAGRVALLELGTLKSNEYYEQPLSSFYSLFKSTLCVEAINDILPSISPLASHDIQLPWIKGGYPEPVLKSNETFYNHWMAAYQDTYINRDIAALFPRLNRVAYRRFIMLLCKLSGNILNKRDLARTVEIGEKSISEYLTIATGTFLWRSLPSYEGNIIKSIVKMPKGHIQDTGLMHYFLKISTFEDLYESVFIGDSFEAFVVEELIKGLQATDVSNWEPYYYRTRDGAEIDLILEGPFGCLPIEIKFGVQTHLKQLSALKRFIDELNLPFGIVINQAERPQWLTPKIIQIPIGWI